jgi:hypothetical protein
MSEVRILLRSLLLVPAALVVLTCASTPPDLLMMNPNPCADGAGRKSLRAPIVCVDDTGAMLRVSPDPVVADDRHGGRPVVIHWWTTSGGGELRIEGVDACLTNVECSGDHCMAKTVDVPEAEAWVRCKYDVWTNAENRLDPDIVITECCRR